jgi:DNA-binding transcriptional MerR regulator
MSFEIPDKIYFKIGEVSKLAEVAPHVIRYWESEFDQISPKRAGSNQRLYKREDVELILKIKTLLHIKGYTIAGARKFLQSGQEQQEERGQPNQAATRQHLHRIKSELLQLYKQLEQKK